MAKGLKNIGKDLDTVNLERPEAKFLLTSSHLRLLSIVLIDTYSYVTTELTVPYSEKDSFGLF